MNYVVKTTEFAERPRGRCGQQMESCAGGGTLSKKCAKNANWTGVAALSPRRRGYAAKIMRRKNARRKFGKRASGESHYRNPCGIIRNIWYTAMRRSLLSPFFHYYNIIVTFFDLSGFFRSRPESPVIRAFRLVKSACFISLRRGLTNISCGGIISAQKEQMFVSTRGVYPNHRPVSPGGYFNRKTEQMFD